MIQPRFTSAQLIIGACALGVLGACAVRFCYLPSFWLDEAFVAVSLRNPTAQSILAQLRKSRACWNRYPSNRSKSPARANFRRAETRPGFSGQNITDEYCHEWLNEARSRALSWQVVHQGPGRGLALAEF